MLLEAVTRDTKLCRSLAGKDSVPPGTYNCIAYTTGIKNVWVDPYQTVEGWDLYYGREFSRSKTPDVSYEAGLLKVAVYATVTTDGKAKCTHAALQHDDGTWSSKLGSGPLIRHRTAESVSGPIYGEVVLVYVKKK